METLVDTFKAEQASLHSQKETLVRAKAKLRAKKGKLLQSRKTVENAAKSLTSAEKTFSRKLDDLNSIFAVSQKFS